MDQDDTGRPARPVIPVDAGGPPAADSPPPTRKAPWWTGLAVALPVGIVLCIDLRILAAFLPSQAQPPRPAPLLVASEVGFWVLLAFGCVVLTRQFLRLLAGLDRVDHNPVPWGVPFGLAVFLAWLLAPELVLMGVAGTTKLEPWLKDNFAEGLYGGSAFKFAAAVLALALAWKVYGGSERALSHGLWRFVRAMGVGILALSGALPLVLMGILAAFAAFGLPRQEIADRLSETLGDPGIGMSAKVLMVFSVVALVPFAEEVVFRVFLQGGVRGSLSRLAGRGGRRAMGQAAAWIAIVATAALFAWMHTGGGWSQLGVAPPLFGLAIALGYAYERTKNLVVIWTMHAAFNAGSVLLMILSK
jgi:membrane protease YdiL (CAAX protease family)